MIALSAALLAYNNGAAQTIMSLKEEIAAAEGEIKRTNLLLDENKSKQSVNSSQLSLVRSTIKNRNKIISSLDKQSSIIKRDISSNNNNLSQLEKELIELKKEYSATLVAGYKNYKLSNYILFLFSARDFNDLAIRLYYLRIHSQQREQQAQRIRDREEEIGGNVALLKQKQDELSSVVDEKNQEVKKLSQEEGQYNAMLTALKSEEGDLSAAIRKRQHLINQLNNKVEELIAEEARKLNGESASSAAQAAYIVELTGDFDQNRGKLPLPIRGGVIVEPFGTHPHPTQPNLKVTNKGVNIAGAAGSQIYSVFKGEVSKVFFFQGLNNCVMIRHGKYISVYSNLSKVNVKVGDKVETLSKLGTLAAAKESQDGTLHFELWLETTVIDPALWLDSSR